MVLAKGFVWQRIVVALGAVYQPLAFHFALHQLVSASLERAHESNTGSLPAIASSADSREDDQH